MENYWGNTVSKHLHQFSPTGKHRHGAEKCIWCGSTGAALAYSFSQSGLKSKALFQLAYATLYSRQAHGERGAAPGFGLHVNRAAVVHHYPFGDHEAQPGAVLL